MSALVELMWWRSSRYRKVQSSSSDEESVSEESFNEKRENSTEQSYKLTYVRGALFKIPSFIFGTTVGKTCMALVLAGVLTMIGYAAGAEQFFPQNNSSDHYANTYICPDADLSTRREWNHLSEREKTEYVGAVKCLMELPSRARPSGRLFDDFAYIRGHVGMHTNGVASFLPWNRYFLHIFEYELRNSCGFTGNLTYWNWSRNWKSLADSEVFASTSGFGANGKASVSKSGKSEHCVQEGIFANRSYPYDFKVGVGVRPVDHCLSRHFPEEDRQGAKAGVAVSPQNIKTLIAENHYEGFCAGLQQGPKKAIESWVNGDFGQYTGATDPLYFLHLVALDRLWWLWQHQVDLLRFDEYSGLKRHDFSIRATLDDEISLGGELAPDVKVRDVMWGQWSVLCYTY